VVTAGENFSEMRQSQYCTMVSSIPWYRPWRGLWSRQELALSIQPVRHLQEESICRMQMKEIADIPSEVFCSLARQELLAP
jgi:hypothetical protein